MQTIEPPKVDRSPRYVFRFRHVCPCCDKPWLADYACSEAEGQSNPSDPLRLGLALLCGVCEALRIAHIVDDVTAKMYAPQQPYMSWPDGKSAYCWQKIRENPGKYTVKMSQSKQTVAVSTRDSATLESGEVVPLRDDKTAEMDRIFNRRNGQGGIVLTIQQAIDRGLPVKFDTPRFVPPSKAKVCGGDQL